MTSRYRDLRDTIPLAPPPTESRTLAQWQRDISDAVNEIPAFSFFSAGHPNSNVTANVGTLGFNYGAESSATSVLWIKQVGSDNLGWAPIG